MGFADLIFPDEDNSGMGITPDSFPYIDELRTRRMVVLNMKQRFFIGEHAVHCKELSGFKYRHDLVRDVLYDVLKRAGISAKKQAR
ncbi:putative exostosin [Helianthus debilis subsp. tardiflorus]